MASFGLDTEYAPF